MRFNPFRPNSIIHPGMFAGRGPELLLLERALHQTANGNPAHFLIHGERGIGKSSLLMVVDSLATGKLTFDDGTRCNFLTVGIELEPNDTYPEIIAKVARELQRELDRNEQVRAMLTAVWGAYSAVAGTMD